LTDHLHIVCLDAPGPPDYGGVFDLYYKIPALAAIGKKIHLHYFDYHHDRNAKGLEAFCESISVYKRSGLTSSLFTNKPYIISSRINSQLISSLNKDNHPVIFEGIHCAGLIPYLDEKRSIVLRLHNDEAVYYRNLYRYEQNVFKKIYFGREARLLERFQNALPKDLKYACVSTSDMEAFRIKYALQQAYFIPCFLPWQTISSLPGKGDYCLYHGNLEVSENILAARWLTEEVFSKMEYRLVIAGRSAKKNMGAIRLSNIEIVDSPSDASLSELIQNAQVNILPSMNDTGVKLKLLHALFTGRHCITNERGVKGSGLTGSFHLAETPEDFISLIDQLFSVSFAQPDIDERSRQLKLYNNPLNAEKLNALL
jgi:hypothetical protein